MLSKGLAYEKVAQKYLHHHGLTTIDSNFRSKFGEIDLVMKENDTIVFVEVRYRSASNYGHASETVTRSKQSKISKTASLYLTKERLWNKPCRFDVITISNKEPNEEIDWLKAAFSAS